MGFEQNGMCECRICEAAERETWSGGGAELAE